VNPYEVESQLSAMFDGELPAAECELLSRRLDRDEALRARWSRYALIGSAMRSEPVATARRGFAGRVSAALQASEPGAAAPSAKAAPAERRTANRIWSAALAASMAVAVAGISITLLRHAALSGGADVLAQNPAQAAGVAPSDTAPAASPVQSARRADLLASAAPGSSLRHGGSEPISYVTPAANPHPSTALRTQLADFIVAHSEYSTPLMRRNLLSALVSNDPANDNAADATSFGSAAAAALGASAGRLDATTAQPAATH